MAVFYTTNFQDDIPPNAWLRDAVHAAAVADAARVESDIRVLLNCGYTLDELVAIRDPQFRTQVLPRSMVVSMPQE